MSEQAQVQQLSEDPVTTPGLFSLDEEEIIVPVTSAGVELPLLHKMRRATKAELVEREQHVEFEEHKASDTETETIYDSDEANEYLWDKTILAVSGYDFEDGKPEEAWREVDNVKKKLIPVTHKVRAVGSLYLPQSAVARDKKTRGFRLLGETAIRVEQKIGGKPDFVVTHVLRRPTESEWSKYRRRGVRVLTVAGVNNGNAHMKYQTNLSAACDLYDAILERIEGVSLGGHPFRPDQRAAYIEAVDAVYKQHVITAFAADYQVGLRD